MMPSDIKLPRNPKSCFLNLSYTFGNSPGGIEQIISDYFKGRGFEIKTGRMAQAGEKLDKGILQVIKSCGFGIVVYNELRHNISYEWGIMDGLGIPAILFKNTNTHIDLDQDISDKKGTTFVGYAGESDKKEIIEELEKSKSLKAAIENVERLVGEQISPEKTEETIAVSKLIVESNIPLGELVIGENKESIKEMNEIIDAMDKVKHLTAVGRFNKANVYYYAGRYEDSEEELRNVIKLNPDYAEAHYNLGILFYNLKRFGEAEKEYRGAIRINPDFAEAHINLGILLKGSKRFNEAEKEYRGAIRINPDYVEAHINLGILLHNLKRFNEAEGEYREAIRINPDFAEAHGNLGDLLKDLKQFDEAEKEWREAIRINPDFAEAHGNLGILLKGSKRFNEAEGEYREAIRINPDFAEAHNNLGILLSETERPEEAKKELKTAKKLFEKQEREADVKKVDGLLKLIR
ncbi:MAG: hypothetical protein AEth_01574 [Candidatus Argoarchaeum ethanivorans]|uniref:Tetratricopeptide repeat protein n=1 Tax=Candidatus Argoarchaeum ethanivorans TaxID=2608793 RepID=A0A8B3S1D6_9EURY|nr:MAG: hypothetical protein AEth_01574 [Candidatus Argoarchaeum ethanivorans]